MPGYNGHEDNEEVDQLVRLGSENSFFFMQGSSKKKAEKVFVMSRTQLENNRLSFCEKLSSQYESVEW